MSIEYDEDDLPTGYPNPWEKIVDRLRLVREKRLKSVRDEALLKRLRKHGYTPEEIAERVRRAEVHFRRRQALGVTGAAATASLKQTPEWQQRHREAARTSARRARATAEGKARIRKNKAAYKRRLGERNLLFLHLLLATAGFDGGDGSPSGSSGA